jgi:IS5 family transposase
VATPSGVNIISVHSAKFSSTCGVIPQGEREPNRSFFHLNEIEDRIMRKDTTTAKINEVEIERNKKISKKRYIIEQYFGLSHLNDTAYRARFTTIMKNLWDTMCRQMAFNL